VTAVSKGQLEFDLGARTRLPNNDRDSLVGGRSPIAPDSHYQKDRLVDEVYPEQPVRQ
jgi:hypothetical protein